MSNLYAKLGLETPDTLPECPEVAVVLAGLFTRLGAHFMIDHRGKRLVMLPEPCHLRLTEGRLPDAVPNAKPHEQFINNEQYRGAMRMLGAMLSRLHPSDKTLVYDAFAIAATEVDAAA